jgi:hypothetical protein
VLGVHELYLLVPYEPTKIAPEGGAESFVLEIGTYDGYVRHSASKL